MARGESPGGSLESVEQSELTDQSREAPTIFDRGGQPRKLRPGPGHSAAEVSESQLVRLRAAMVELCDEAGYEAVTVRTLARRAEVSTRTFYEHFRGKQDCLLDTYRAIMRQTARRIATSHRGVEDWRERLRLALGAFARQLADDPPAARLALVEVAAAGLAVLDPMAEVEARFEAMLADCLSRARGGAAPPPLVAKALAAGIVRTVRVRVLAGEEARLPELVDDLLAWVICFGGEAAAELGREDRAPAVDSAAAEPLGASGDGFQETDHPERRLLLSAATTLATREGYWGLSGARISAEAGLSPRSFTSHFEDPEACFLACLQLLNDRVLALAEKEGGRLPDWPSGVHRALSVLAVGAARDPALARLAFVDVFAPGTAGLRQRVQLISVLAERLRSSAPEAQRPGEVAADASLGAIWGVVRHYVVSGRECDLPRIAPLLSFLALAPAIGSEPAADLICPERHGVPVGRSGTAA